MVHSFTVLSKSLLRKKEVIHEEERNTTQQKKRIVLNNSVEKTQNNYVEFKKNIKK